MATDFSLVARHGGLLAVVASAIVMIALRLNPRLFLRHFPQAVKETQPPLSPVEKASGRVVGMMLILLLVGLPVWSARSAAIQRAYGPIDAFVHAFLVAMAFNLVDWLLLDELWLGRVKPRWAIPPGVDPADVPFDRAQHARGFVRGTVLCAGVGALASLAVFLR